ncbi:uncharacterized protein LOC141913010 [Tubulanus polymorphus]|uniref:uncharacterized protein LOC141913010 n=1 Tax=Tubulanus polymorphus TaxID=672921 RepID=UPI003DA5DD3E
MDAKDETSSAVADDAPTKSDDVALSTANALQPTAPYDQTPADDFLSVLRPPAAVAPVAGEKPPPQQPQQQPIFARTNISFPMSRPVAEAAQPPSYFEAVNAVEPGRPSMTPHRGAEFASWLNAECPGDTRVNPDTNRLVDNDFEKPPSYGWLAGVTALFCFFAAIAAWHYSSQVGPLWSQGRYEEARRYSNKTKTIALIGIFIGCVIITVLGVYYGILFNGF